MANNGSCFPIYKGTGAAKFSLISPRFNDRGYVSKNGAVLLEAAPSSGRQQWDWENKIAFAIGLADICNIMENPEAPPKLFHDHGGTAKTLEFVPGTGRHEGTFMMKLSQKVNGNWETVSVPLTGGEWTVLVRLLLESVSSMIAWY